MRNHWIHNPSRHAHRSIHGNRPILSGQALFETNFVEYLRKAQDEEPDRFSETYYKVQKWLLCALTSHEVVQPNIRSNAGNTLGRLGDPRDEVVKLNEMQFCFIPAGPF